MTTKQIHPFIKEQESDESQEGMGKFRVRHLFPNQWSHSFIEDGLKHFPKDHHIQNEAREMM